MYRKKTEDWIANFDFMIFDIIAVELSFFIAYIIRHGSDSIKNGLPELYVNVALLLIVFAALQPIALKSYDGILVRGQYKEFKKTVKYVTITTVMLVLYLYMFKKGDIYSRAVYIITWEMDVILTYFFRISWKNVKKKSIEKSQKGRNSFVLVTVSDMAEETVKTLLKDINIAISGIIIIDKDMAGEKILGIDVVVNKKNAMDYICRSWVDEIFINVSEEYSDYEAKLVDDCVVMGITVHKRLANTYSTAGCIKIVQNMSEYTVLSSMVNTVSLNQMFIKRLLDIVGGIVGLIITGILFIFVAPVIYIKSPGPIFFKQWRVGRNGKKFQIYKFRSMYMDAEERKAELMAKNKIKDGMMFKIENDPRIIGGENGKGIGNFIRNTSIDEFPQFFNVLKGDMSLVGTRPPTLDEWEKYKLHHRKRMAAKPGLTGMWQVSGRSDITDFEEVVKLDTEYITNWSFGKDIKILLKTVKVVLFGKGSY